MTKTTEQKVDDLKDKLYDMSFEVRQDQEGGEYFFLLNENQLLSLIEQETIKAFDDGYDAGRKEKPAKLIDAIEFRREQYGWNNTKMAAMLDMNKTHYSEFINGHRGLPVNSIRKAYAIGIPAKILLQDDIESQLTPSPNKIEET